MKTTTLYIKVWLDSIEDKRLKTFPNRTLLSLSATKKILPQKHSINQLKYQLTLTQQILT